MKTISALILIITLAGCSKPDWRSVEIVEVVAQQGQQRYTVVEDREGKRYAMTGVWGKVGDKAVINFENRISK